MISQILAYAIIFLVGVILSHQIWFLYTAIKKGHFIFREMRIKRVSNKKLFYKIVYIRSAIIIILLIALGMNLFFLF